MKLHRVFAGGVYRANQTSPQTWFEHEASWAMVSVAPWTVTGCKQQEDLGVYIRITVGIGEVFSNISIQPFN